VLLVRVGTVLREWLGTRTAVLIAFIVAVVLLTSFCQARSARDGSDQGNAPVRSEEKKGTLYERARRTENPPEYTIGFADRHRPEHYSIGVITEPTNDKARLGAIAVTEARDRSVDHVTVFFAESEAALQRRDVFGGAHLIRPKRSLTVDLG
jgi:hypothetical protein